MWYTWVIPDKLAGIPGGRGRCRREAARSSPGDSYVTAGAPKERPIRDETEPPSEWPVSQIVALGYMYVILL